MGKLGKPGKKTDKKKSKDDKIDLPLESICLAMCRKQEDGGKKKKLSPEDGTKKSQSCRKKIKLGDDLVISGKKKKYPKQHDIPDDVLSSGKKKK